MKNAIVVLSLAMVALVPARAQLLRPEAVNGAVLGGVAGAVIGHNSGDLRHNAWKGAAIGAGAGLILGEMAGNARAAATATEVPAPRGPGRVYRDRPDVYVGIGYDRGSGYGARYRGHDRGYGYGAAPLRDPWAYRRYGYSGYGWGPSVYASVPVYGYYPGYGDAYPYYGSYGGYRSGGAASTGLILGALAGGIVGHNSGDFRHNGWRGAAWGAGAGWLLGSVLDAGRRESDYERARVVATPSEPTPAAPASQPAPVTIINNYYNAPSPMSSANGLFGR